MAPASGFAADLPLAARYAVSESLGRGDASYAARGAGDVGFAIQNPANAYAATVAASGFRIASGAESWSLTVQGLGYGEDVRALGSGVATALANRVEYDHGAVTQWFVNGPLGLQQGFTLDVRPEGSPADGPLTIRLAVEGLTARAEPGGTSIALARADGARIASYGGLIAYDAEGRAIPATMTVDASAGGPTVSIRVDDAEAVYPLVVDPYVQRAALPVNSPSFAMSADGRTLVVGVLQHTEGDGPSWAGAVFVYARSGESWVETARVQADVPIEGAWFGLSTALSGDGQTLFVGAARASTDVIENGVVYVFVRSGSGWEQVRTIEPETDAPGGFGVSIATNSDGSVLALADVRDVQQYDLYGPDEVRIYSRDGSTWDLDAVFVSPAGPSFTSNGPAMEFDASGRTLLVGAPYERSFAGQVFLFTSGPEGWSRHLLTDVDPNVQFSHMLGRGAALSGDGGTMLVSGAWAFDANGFPRYSALIYERSGDDWVRAGELPLPTGFGVVGGDGPVALNADGTLAVALARPAREVGPIPVALAHVFEKEAGAWRLLSTFLLRGAGDFTLAFAADVLAVGSDGGLATDPVAGPGGLRIFSYEPGFEVTAPPRDLTTVGGRLATFTAEAGAPGLTAAWQVSTDNGFTWADLDGGEVVATVDGTTQSWIAATTPPADGPQYYRVVFTDPETGQVQASFPAALKSRAAEVTVELEAPGAPIRVGESTTLAIRVRTNSAGLPAPSGRIEVGVGSLILEATLVDGRAVVTIPNTLKVGDYDVYARYFGDAYFQPMVSTQFIVVVERRGSLLTAEIPAETVAGLPTTLTAVLSPRDLPLEPSGGVVFLDGGRPIAFIPVVRAGGRLTATFSTAGLAAGNHYFQLVFLGDARTAAASSGVYRITVKAKGTTAAPGLALPLALGALSSPATAEAPSGTTGPVGSIDADATHFVDVGDEVALAIPDGGTFASIQWQTSDDQGASWRDAPGATGAWYRLTALADDSGRWFRARLVDGEGTTVFSSPEVLEVALRPVRLFLESFPSRPIIGDGFTIAVRATPLFSHGERPPEGNVTLTLGTFTQTRPLVDGTARFDIPGTTPAGYRTARVTYEASSPEFAAASIEAPVAVGRGAAGFTAAVPLDVRLPNALELIVNVRALEGREIPTGGVMVLDGGQPIALLPLGPYGYYATTAASLRLTAGDHYLQFVYLGDPKTQMVSSGVYRVVVSPEPTTRGGAAPAPAPVSLPVAVAGPTSPQPGRADSLAPTTSTAVVADSPATPSRPRGVASAFAARATRGPRSIPTAAPIRPRPRAVDPTLFASGRLGKRPGSA
ncbi:Ig-like domain repeat protein [Planctomyces sp. SH-PL62]|uniref:Ig-like domain repeat protein n=1 Tax=Planctomyces sp. SH-PL62 TaxID=1636152 RepID=UPI0012E782B6|nr:Ig-like domain repeat protein [Planctomyces sp. SH-PL62]